MELLRVYDYVMQTRARVLDSVRTLTPAQYTRHFPFGMNTVARTLTHLMLCEWYYVERLQGRHVPPYPEWPIQDEKPPAFEVLDSTWRAQAPRVRAMVAAEKAWKRPVTWDSFPDSKEKRFRITTTAEDVVMQLALHEVHHRAQVMSMMRGMGEGVAPIEDLDFGYVVFGRTPLA